MIRRASNRMAARSRQRMRERWFTRETVYLICSAESTNPVSASSTTSDRAPVRSAITTMRAGPQVAFFLLFDGTDVSSFGIEQRLDTSRETGVESAWLRETQLMHRLPGQSRER